MQAINLNIIKLTAFYVIGILIGYYYNVAFSIAFSFSSASCLLLFLLYKVTKRTSQKRIVFGVLAVIAFTSLGMLSLASHHPKYWDSHYTNNLTIHEGESYAITFRVNERLKPTTYHTKYVIDLISINGTATKGKMLLNVEKDSLLNKLEVDDILVTKAMIQSFKKPLNPYQFDYKNYLERQYIYHQISIDGQTLVTLGRTKHTLHGLAAGLRQRINQKLEGYSFHPDELAIINALFLGQRQDISKTVNDNYAQAGAIHILAVSGLHVGILYLMLNWLFKPLLLFHHGKKIKLLLIIVCLWSFAVIAGLSASVTRAVTMFSIVAIGMHLNRVTNIYSTLITSMFILLLFKPLFLFDVGFQMSYLAVFFIVWVQPGLYGLFTIKFWLFDKLWQIITVTLAAQLGVIPISIYYFHQLPGLFLISNLIIVPLLGVILGLGLLSITMALCNVLPDLMAQALSYSIRFINGSVALISEQESFLIKDISFSTLMAFCSYVFIVAGLLFIKNCNYKNLRLLLASIVIYLTGLIYNKHINSTDEFVIFHKNRHSLIGFKKGRNLNIFHNLSDTIIKTDRSVTDYKIGNWIRGIKTDSLKSVYMVNDKLILVVDSLGIYNTSFKPDYVLLRNSPKIHLERLIKTLKPELIIADGSNYKTYQDRWKATCLKQNIPFYQTDKKGAFIIK